MNIVSVPLRGNINNDWEYLADGLSLDYRVSVPLRGNINNDRTRLDIIAYLIGFRPLTGKYK